MTQKHTGGRWYYTTGYFAEKWKAPTVTIYAEVGDDIIDICVMEPVIGFSREAEENARHICDMHNAMIDNRMAIDDYLEVSRTPSFEDTVKYLLRGEPLPKTDN